jgi:hypothetical protein
MTPKLDVILEFRYVSKKNITFRHRLSRIPLPFFVSP